MYVAERFPVNSLQQITILPDHEVITGRVYCTDEITRTLILQKALTYTTLSSEIRIVSLNSIVHSQQLQEKDGVIVTDTSDKETTTGEDTVRATPLTQPLPIIQKKALEERERRAIRLAEESLRHINPKVTCFTKIQLFVLVVIAYLSEYS
jgi:protein LSM12